MTVSAGNLDELLSVTGYVTELYGVTVQSLSTVGNSTVISAASVVTNGTDAPGTDSADGQEFSVSTVNDQTDVATLVLAFSNSLVGQLDDATVVGFNSDALLLYTNGTGSLITSPGGTTLNDADFAVFSADPLAAGTTLNFTSSGVFDGPLTPPVIPSATQATVTGAGGVTLLVDFASSFLASQAQPQFTAISAAIEAGSAVAESVSGGSLPAVPSGDVGLAEIDAGGNVALPAGYADAIDLASGPVSLFASAAGNQLVVDGGSGDFTYGAVAGVETVYAGIGNTLVFGGGASLDFFGNTGASTIIGGNAGNTISGGDGTQLIFGSSSLSYSGGTGAATIIGGGSGNSVIGGTGNLLLFASSSMQYTGFGGAATVIGGGGSLNADLGSGGGTAYGGPGGGNTLATSSSTASVLVGGGTGDLLTATGSGADVLVAGGGAETINGAGATGNLVIFGGPGSDVLSGGTGNDLFIAEPGNETLTGGGGTNSYVFIDFGTTSKTDVITDFNPNTDAIGLFGYGAADAAALASAKTTGGITTVSLTDGTKIQLLGAPTLHSYNFF